MCLRLIRQRNAPVGALPRTFGAHLDGLGAFNELARRKLALHGSLRKEPEARLGVADAYHSLGETGEALALDPTVCDVVGSVNTDPPSAVALGESLDAQEDVLTGSRLGKDDLLGGALAGRLKKLLLDIRGDSTREIKSNDINFCVLFFKSTNH